MTIKFPDLSHFEAGVSLAGVPALLTKATQGVDYTDPTYAGYKAAAHAAGIPFAGYHYVTLDDPQAQAEHAFAVLGTTPAMWDVEKGSSTFAHLLAVDSAFTALGGRALFAYIPHWYWEQIGRPDLTPLLARGLALISSQYTTYSDTGPGWAPYGGVAPTIWQYTDAGPLNGRHVDMNAFKGSATELRRLFTPDNPPDQGVDMPLTDADAAVIWAHLLHNDVTNTDVPAGTFLRSVNTGVNDLRVNLVPAVAAAEQGDTNALVAIQQALAGLPAAVVAALPSIAGGQPGFTDAQLAQIEQAVADVLGHTTAALTVTPPATS